MPLINIEYGSLASSEVMNDNFAYLDDRITNNAESAASNNASLLSNLLNLNNTLTQTDNEIKSDLSDLEEDVTELRSDFDSQNNAPDYSKGIGITLPYTVQSDGYVYAGVSGIDACRYVYVNGHIVHGHCGYSGGVNVYSGSLFRVSSGDSVTCDVAFGSYYFYPMKGV